MPATIARREQARLPRTGNRGVRAADPGDDEQDDNAHHADTEFEKGVDSQRVMARADVPRQQQAAEAHATHEDAEENAERDRRGADRELQELEPDDFVYESRAPGSDKEQEERRQPSPAGFEAGVLLC